MDRYLLPYDDSVAAYVVNIVSAGRSRVLPLTVVGSQLLLTYHIIQNHYVGPLLGHSCDPSARWVCRQIIPFFRPSVVSLQVFTSVRIKWHSSRWLIILTKW